MEGSHCSKWKYRSPLWTPGVTFHRQNYPSGSGCSVRSHPDLFEGTKITAEKEKALSFLCHFFERLCPSVFRRSRMEAYMRIPPQWTDSAGSWCSEKSDSDKTSFVRELYSNETCNWAEEVSFIVWSGFPSTNYSFGSHFMGRSSCYLKRETVDHTTIKTTGYQFSAIYFIGLQFSVGDRPTDAKWWGVQSSSVFQFEISEGSPWGARAFGRGLHVGRTIKCMHILNERQKWCCYDRLWW